MPAGWSLTCSKVVSAEQGGLIVGIDLLPFLDVPNVIRIEGERPGGLFAQLLLLL